MRWTAVAVALVGAMVIAWHVTDLKARRELEVARAAFEEHGFPMRLEEIIPPPVPAEEYADALLREAWRVVSGAPDWQNTEAIGALREIDRHRLPPLVIRARPVRFTPETLVRLQVLIGDPQCVAFEKAIAAAIRCPCWRSAIDYMSPPAASDPAFEPTRSMINLLLTIGETETLTPGRRDAGWRNLAAAHKLADCVGQPPTFGQLLSRKYLHDLTTDAMLRVLGTTGALDDPGVLIEQLLSAAAEPTEEYERAMHSTRLLRLDWVMQKFVQLPGDWAKDGAETLVPGWAEWSLPWVTPVVSSLGRTRFTTHLAETYAMHLECTRAVARGGPSTYLLLDALMNEADASENFLIRGIIANQLKYVRDLSEGCAQQRALIVLFGAWRHHQTTGFWPAAADALGLPTEVTRDPCSGQPIRLLATTAELIAYAHGFDGDDDGGRELDLSASPTRDGDIVVRVQLRSDRAE